MLGLFLLAFYVSATALYYNTPVFLSLKWAAGPLYWWFLITFALTELLLFLCVIAHTVDFFDNSKTKYENSKIAEKLSHNIMLMVMHAFSGFAAILGSLLLYRATHGSTSYLNDVVGTGSMFSVVVFNKFLIHLFQKSK